MERSVDVRHPCPCCGSLTIEEPGNYDICDVCGWEDDDLQSDDPEYAGGANDMSLNQARAAFKKRQPAK